jgi:tetratricopeptide (TPR) repeat protein
MDKFSLLEKYFEETLSVSEQKIFEELLDSDDELKEEFEFQMNLKKVIQQEQKAFLKQEFQDLEKERFNKENSSKSAFSFLRIAASVVLLISLGAYFFLNKDVSNQNIFEEQFTAYPNVVYPIVRGEGKENDNQYLAFLAYEGEDYQKALSLFEKSYEESNVSYLLIYKSICLLKIQEPEKAITSLQEYIAKDQKFQDKAYWYLALSYLKVENTEQAVRCLEKVIALDNFNQDKAKSILKQLKK